jgi:hypothetical protein
MAFRIKSRQEIDNELRGALDARGKAKGEWWFSIGPRFKNHRTLEGEKVPGLFWFRVFGYGIHGKDVRKHTLLYSERSGSTCRLQIGQWSFRWLKPSNY